MSDESGRFSFLSGILAQAAVAVGIAEVVHEADSAQAPHSVPPPPTSVSFSTSGSGASPALPQSAQFNVGRQERVTERMKRNLESVFHSAPPRFQEFLDDKERLLTALADSLSGEQLMAAATKGALKTSKMTIEEVQQAVRSMRSSQSSTARDFTETLAGKKKEKVQDPTEKIQQTRTQIEEIERQIAILEDKKLKLEQGIAPAEQGIAQATAELAEAEQIYTAADGKVTEFLNVFEQQLLGLLSK